MGLTLALASTILLGVAADAASADKCGSLKLKALAAREAGLLRCRAKVAASGDASGLASCEAAVTSQFASAFGKAGSCGGAQSRCEEIADGCASSVAAVLTDTFPSKCESAKRKAAGTLAKKELGCHAKAAKTGRALKASCIEKARRKFDAARKKAGTCTDGGDPRTAIESLCVAPAVALDQGSLVAGICPIVVTTTSSTLTSSNTTTTTGAGTFTLDAVASGFYKHTAEHQPGNYAVGWYPAGIAELRDYFVFDLSTVTGTVTSAFLRLSTAPPAFIRYGSSDPSETYTLFDVSTALAALTGGTGGVPAFNDLGGGTSYGNFVATSAIGETVDIPLNAAGIAFLAGSSGQVALGGAITTLSMGPTTEFLFNSTNAGLTRQLVVTTQ